MKEQKLTIKEANSLAKGKLVVEKNDIDSRLWTVYDNDAVQVHEPMSKEEWLNRALTANF